MDSAPFRPYPSSQDLGKEKIKQNEPISLPDDPQNVSGIRFFKIFLFHLLDWRYWTSLEGERNDSDDNGSGA